MLPLAVALFGLTKFCPGLRNHAEAGLLIDYAVQIINFSCEAARWSGKGCVGSPSSLSARPIAAWTCQMGSPSQDAEPMSSSKLYNIEHLPV